MDCDAADQDVFECRRLVPGAGEHAVDCTPGILGRAHRLRRCRQFRLVAPVFMETGAAETSVHAVAQRREIVVEDGPKDAALVGTGYRPLWPGPFDRADEPTAGGRPVS